MIANKLVKQVPMLPTGISERLITLRIPIGKTRCATIFSVYAPTMTNSDQSKEELYGLLDYVITLRVDLADVQVLCVVLTVPPITT